MSRQPPNRRIHISIGRRCVAYAIGGLCLGLRAAGIWRLPGNRVVILEPYGMGDVLSLQPLVQLLRAANLNVAVCGRAPWRPLIPKEWNVQWVDACVPWTNYTMGGKYGRLLKVLSDMVRQIRVLRPMTNGSIGIDPRGDIRSIFMLRAAGCRRVISLSRYLGTDLPVLPGVADRLTPAEGMRRWEQNVQMAQALGIKAPDDLPPPRLQHLAPLRVVSQTKVGLVPIAPWPGKEWIPTHWRELAKRLRNEGYNPMAFCGPGQEAALEQVLGSSVPRICCTSVEAWCDQLAELRAVVTVDTGPMHLAAALNVPLIALMGSSVLPLWAPAGNASHVIHHQDAAPCAPCHQVGTCSHSTCLAMSCITVDEVHHRLQSILQAGHDPHMAYGYQSSR